MLPIIALNQDVIFLTDTRLGAANKAMRTSLQDLLTNNGITKYNAIWNSSKSTRGVGILIKDSINFSISNIMNDPSENALGILASINGRSVYLLNIYGPNQNDGQWFDTIFKEVNQTLSTVCNPVLIAGGDWNTILCSEPASLNIDLIKAGSIPNKQNQKKYWSGKTPSPWPTHTGCSTQLLVTTHTTRNRDWGTAVDWTFF